MTSANNVGEALLLLGDYLIDGGGGTHASDFTTRGDAYRALTDLQETLAGGDPPGALPILHPDGTVAHCPGDEPGPLATAARVEGLWKALAAAILKVRSGDGGKDEHAGRIYAGARAAWTAACPPPDN